MKVTISCSACSERNFIELDKPTILEQDFEELLACSGHRDDSCVIVADLYDSNNVLIYTRIKTTEPPPEEAPPEDPTKPWWQFW